MSPDPSPGAREPIVGVLLAGGRARRMGGGDKCLRPLTGKTILDHVIARARPQVDRLVLNAPGDPARFARYELPVVTDAVPDFAGPLAGILTGMLWAREHVADCRWLASFATDTPLFPRDLVMRLCAAAADGADIACAASAGRSHPVFAVWPVRLAEALQTALVEEGFRKIDAWTAGYRVATVTFPAEPHDPFFNVNTPDDLNRAAELIAAEVGR